MVGKIEARVETQVERPGSLNPNAPVPKGLAEQILCGIKYGLMPEKRTFAALHKALNAGATGFPYFERLDPERGARLADRTFYFPQECAQANVLSGIAADYTLQATGESVLRQMSLWQREIPLAGLNNVSWGRVVVAEMGKGAVALVGIDARGKKHNCGSESSTRIVVMQLDESPYKKANEDLKKIADQQTVAQDTLQQAFVLKAISDLIINSRFAVDIDSLIQGAQKLMIHSLMIQVAIMRGILITELKGASEGRPVLTAGELMMVASGCRGICFGNPETDDLYPPLVRSLGSGGEGSIRQAILRWDPSLREHHESGLDDLDDIAGEIGTLKNHFRAEFPFGRSLTDKILERK